MKLILLVLLPFFLYAYEGVENCKVGNFWKDKKEFILKSGLCDKNCKLYYKNNEIEHIEIKYHNEVKGKNYSDISLIGSYYLNDEDCLTKPNYVEVMLKYRHDVIVPLCDFVKFVKTNDSLSTGRLVFHREGLCRVRVIKKVSFDFTEKEYKIEYLKIGKDGNIGLTMFEPNFKLYNVEKLESVYPIFHTCSKNSCRISIITSEKFTNNDSISIASQCDFLKVKKNYLIEDESWGDLISIGTGQCDLNIEIVKKVIGQCPTSLDFFRTKFFLKDVSKLAIKNGIRLYSSHNIHLNPNMWYSYKLWNIDFCNRKKQSFTVPLFIPSDLRNLE